jgi:drug/metabolite transporter (DMT)-like permease
MILITMDERRVNLKKGYIYSILSAVLFGSAGLFVKLAYAEGLDSISLLTYQYIIACIIMFSILSLNKGGKLKISFTELKRLAVLGIVGNTSMTIFYYMAFSYLPIPMVAILLYTYPIMVFAYKSFFQREKVTKSQIFALLLAFIGCIMTLDLLKGSLKYSLLGVLFGVLSALFYSFMNIYSEERLQNIEPLTINAYSTLFSLISLLCIKFPSFLFSGPISINLTIYTISLAVFCEIIPLTLLYAGIKNIGSVKVSIIGNLEIPTSIIISTYLLKINMNLFQITGTAMVIYSVYLLKATMD